MYLELLKVAGFFFFFFFSFWVLLKLNRIGEKNMVPIHFKYFCVYVFFCIRFFQYKNYIHINEYFLVKDSNNRNEVL